MDAGPPPAGYDADFLGVDVPLPSPTAPRSTALLGYPRFSVMQDLDRRLAVVTGVNIDGATLLDIARSGSWRLERRIERDQQAGPDVYERNDLDRGHLVRRRDPGWGERDEARAATVATFVYTNAAPQVAGFNQSKDLWLGLEDHVLEYAEIQDLRLSVFTAPVLAAADPPYRGIHIPLRFWKVAAWVDPDAGVTATGFVLDQSELVAPVVAARAVPPLGAFRTFQVALAEIEELAAVDLGPLVAADILSAPGARDTPDWIPLRTPADIRLG
ncbi:DNA/RNA non-specific endonuclease [Microbacterium invictum]|nr:MULTISPECIES: DNA/RNA non-specific endonuclease [Microbacterium]